MISIPCMQNPGQYFIKPLLREYEFTPASKVHSCTMTSGLYTYMFG